MERLHVAVRLLSEPCLWCWEICTGDGRVLESSWTSSWTAYESRRDAEAAGAARLARLGEQAAGTRTPGERTALPRAS